MNLKNPPNTTKIILKFLVPVVYDADMPGTRFGSRAPAAAPSISSPPPHAPPILPSL